MAKLKFFCYVADIIEPYLVKYQTNKPMVPYMYSDLRKLMIKLFGIVVQPKVLEQCKTGKQLLEMDMTDKKNVLLATKDVLVGFAVEGEIGNLKKKDAVNSTMINGFFTDNHNG